MSSKRLGESLIDVGVCSPDQVQIALAEQREQSGRLGDILIALGFCSEAIIQEVLAGKTGKKCVALHNHTVDSAVLALIPEEFARRCGVVPFYLDTEKSQLHVAVEDLRDLAVRDELERLLRGKDLQICLEAATRSDILQAQDRCYGTKFSLPGVLQKLEQQAQKFFVNDSEGAQQPIALLVDALLGDAVKRGASDIHIEPEQGFLRVRYRVDGVLRQTCSLHRSYWSRLLVRVKVLAALDIAESRLAQDGRFSQTLCGRKVDFRVSVLPTIHGENIVLRILDRQRGILSLQHLGLVAEALAEIQAMLCRPQGLILVTGPTGSGKTTTLYAMLQQLDSDENNIMTLEDPVEFPTTRLRQISVNELVKLDYCSGMRALMRQDPDILLIGEIRDEASARMALRAAMTGHQVFSTLHTIDALAAVSRLRELGLSNELIAGNIIGVIAQRLLRKLCRHCRQPYTPSPEQVEWCMRIDQHATKTEFAQLWQATGCSHCDHRGYRDRIAIQENLCVDTTLNELIACDKALPEVYLAARKQGFQNLAERGLKQISAGVSSLQELLRVVDLGRYSPRHADICPL